jgi:hypothetical protein
MPAQISELYLLYVLDHVQQYILECFHKEKFNTTIILLVSRFNPNAVLTVSGKITPIPEKVKDPILAPRRGAAQGLGIAAMLRRLRLRYIAFPEEGQIIIEPFVVQSWTFSIMRKIASKKAKD